jgi:protein ImuB
VDVPRAPGRAAAGGGAGEALRLLVAWCPDWPVQASGFPYEAPVAVLHAGRVVACTPAARADGVAAGLRRREAQRRCPGLVVVAHDPDRDARAFEPVVAAVETVAPKVEILQPGECAFPARGAARYHGGEPELAAEVVAAVDRVLGGTGRCRVGVAGGAFAAGLAARHGVLVPAGETAAFLAPFGVATLDRPDLADLLTRLGLRTLGQLAALPRADLATRFGPEGVRAHRLARGEDERPRNPRRPPPDLRAAAGLDPPAQRAEEAAFAAKRLADELAARLRRHGLACLALRVEVETEHGERLVRVWRHQDGFAVPSRRGRLSPAAGMAERVRWQLDGWLASSAASQPSGAVSRLELAAEEVAADRGRQLGFWGEEGARWERAARALARVQGLLGPDAVRGVELRGGRGPADRVAFTQPGAAPSGSWKPAPPPPRPRPPGAWGGPGPPGAGPQRPGAWGTTDPAPTSPRPPTGWGAADPGRARPAGWAGETAPWPGRVPAPSPAVVHPEPLAAEVVDATGAEVTVGGRGLASAPPARLRVAGGDWTAITAWAGPWPVDERWWDPGVHRRLARVQVVTADGAAHLLKRSDGAWWVEATYD